MSINYPTKKDNFNNVKITSNTTTASKRGMSLETLLNQANEYYLAHGIACIHKKPTPIQVVKVDYKSRATAKITEAYYSTPSTTDYNGVYKGYHIDFEAKQTNLSSLPIHNFHLHQIEHMEHVLAQNGICFVIVYFAKKERFFLLPAKEVIRHYRNQQFNSKKKPFALTQCETVGFEIELASFPLINYIETIEKHLLGGIACQK